VLTVGRVYSCSSALLYGAVHALYDHGFVFTARSLVQMISALLLDMIEVSARPALPKRRACDFSSDRLCVQLYVHIDITWCDRYQAGLAQRSADPLALAHAYEAIPRLRKELDVFFESVSAHPLW
jgi:hypothetical protein